MIKETKQRNIINNLYNIAKEIEVSEVIKDSTMKLFGRTISVIHNNDVSTTNDSSSESELAHPLPDHEDLSDHSSYSSSSSPIEVNSPTEHEAKRIKESSTKEFTSQQTTSSGLTENPKTPSSETETSRLNSTINGEQADMSQDTSPIKPDKIAPCPRCKSMDTKFCYYNNYNVKQPRHFCKNCQRYWTAGGTMRNMLVGAGRRKIKISSSPSVVSQSPVLTFGSDSSIMSSNSPDKKVNVGSHEETFHKSYQSFPPQFPFQGASTFSTPWPYPWNHAMSYPVTFYPNMAYYGGCFPPSWSVQSISNQSLGKHSRDGNILSDSNSEKEKLGSESRNTESINNSVLIPKTLRIDDSNDVAKSSIGSTLGIKNGGGLFKAFESKGADNNHVVDVSSSVLQANPAASSRSLLFHEMV